MNPFNRFTIQRFVAPLVALVALNLAVHGMAQDSEKTKSGRQVPATLNVDVEVELNYLLYLPDDYDSRKEWPMLLFLHGAGERGENLEQVKRHGPPKLIEAGTSLPLIVVSPQCPKGKRWKSIELNALIDSVGSEHKVDPNRIYVTGLSMGGFGTWELAADYPERFAAIAPICGGGEAFWAGQLRKIPIWAFHGADDNVIPLKRSEEMIEAIRAAGGEPKLTIYPETGHDSWTESYDNPELFTWLLEQSRKPDVKPGK